MNQPKWRFYQHLTETQFPNRDWLLELGSLTDRLIKASQNRFSIDLLEQEEGVPHDDEKEFVKLAPHSAFVIRRVRLLCNQVPWVYARTVIPSAAIAAELENLGTCSLGKLLFKDDGATRVTMEVAELKPEHPLFQETLDEISFNPIDSLWARRSLFTWLDHHLMVTEVFTPNVDAE